MLVAWGTSWADASELGTAGPFRSVGGAVCPAGSQDGCAPPPVDTALPLAEQVHAHIARALALLDLVRMTDAKSALDQALKLDPDNVQALTLRGRLAIYDLDGRSAAVDINHALYLAPNDANLLATRGALTVMACECRQALADFNAALKSDPNNIDALFLRAKFYLVNQDPVRAFVDLTTSLALDPDDLRARLMRAKVQLLRKDYDLATLDADKVIAARPHDTDALLTRAVARKSAGDEAGAIDSYTALLEGPAGVSGMLGIPAFRDAMLERARLYLKLKRFDEAKRDLSAIVAQGGQKTILKLQLFLHGDGFPNVDITGARSAAFDSALAACFSDTVCGPNLFR